jgi:hypothetical protein
MITNSAALRIAFLLFLSALFSSHSTEASRESLKRAGVQIVFESEQGQAAREVADIYPSVKEQVTEALGMSADFGPMIVLDRGGSIVRAKTGKDIFVGYAVPANNLIVLDTSRVYARPLTLRTVLKHELCHLTLHSHIKKLPRWLDEGVCQWVSDGLPDMLMNGGGRSLQEALLAGTLIPISDLDEFPPHSVRLAYEQSRSIIEYVQGKFGRGKIREVLRHLKEGSSLDAAFLRSISMTPLELEKRWRADLDDNLPILRYVSQYLYEILFFIAAIITVYGFVIMMRRKRNYDENDNGDGKETFPPEG